ncbi:hypothetical protein GCM10010405_30020 [Streptomyces macrosporus]|uniref:Uncharacterized protein n=1 Tax=Streptomyces macrosporus TaxID=44032 RepID=A0ABN3K2M1_9ACTN
MNLPPNAPKYPSAVGTRPSGSGTKKSVDIRHAPCRGMCPREFGQKERCAVRRLGRARWDGRGEAGVTAVVEGTRGAWKGRAAMPGAARGSRYPVSTPVGDRRTEPDLSARASRAIAFR